jgi:hypothetical protein
MNDFRNHPFYRVHNIDSAMNYLWEFYRRNFLSLFLMSFAMSLIIQYLSTFIDLKDIQSETDPLVVLEKMKVFLVPMLFISLANLFFTTILQHYIINRPVDNSNTVLSSVLKSFRYFIPYLILVILLSVAGTIAIILGLFVLVVGAIFALIYVMTLYLFILPVMMVEESNIASTISRVFSLTHRNFWTNFGWVAVFVILIIVISIVLSGIALLPFAGSYFKTLFNPDDVTAAQDLTKNPLFFFITSLVNALTVPLMPIFASILYFNGKALEERRESGYQQPKEEARVKVEDLYAKPYADDHPDNPDRKETE